MSRPTAWRRYSGSQSARCPNAHQAPRGKSASHPTDPHHPWKWPREPDRQVFPPALARRQIQVEARHSEGLQDRLRVPVSDRHSPQPGALDSHRSTDQQGAHLGQDHQKLQQTSRFGSSPDPPTARSGHNGPTKQHPPRSLRSLRRLHWRLRLDRSQTRQAFGQHGRVFSAAPPPKGTGCGTNMLRVSQSAPTHPRWPSCAGHDPDRSGCLHQREPAHGASHKRCLQRTHNLVALRICHGRKKRD